jgi:hypothetical protein
MHSIPRMVCIIISCVVTTLLPSSSSSSSSSSSTERKLSANDVQRWWDIKSEISQATPQEEEKVLAHLKQFIQQCPGYVNYREPLSFARTLLFSAVRQNQLSIATYLIDNKADIDIADLDSNTPLKVSALAGQVKMTQLLIDRKADVNWRSGCNHGGKNLCATPAAISTFCYIVKLPFLVQLKSRKIIFL